MKLEEEIRQPKFKSDFQKLIVNLVYTGSWISSQSSAMLKPYKLTIQQYNVLRILRGQYPNAASVNLLIERMLDKMSNASRIVDKLVLKKLVERNVCPEDRRKADVVITEKGLTLLKKLDKTVDNWESQLCQINTKEAKQLNLLLDKLRG